MMMGRVGVEPTTHGFSVRCTSDVTHAEPRTTDDHESDSASCSALSAAGDPDFALVAKAWPTLPEAVRAGIVAMIRAASKAPE